MKQVDLTNCDREPIHVPGSIQPFGFLLTLLSDFTMLKTIPGEDYRISLKPADQVAQCIDGVLVLFDTQQKGLTGVLVDNKKQAVRCMGQETPQEVK